MKKLIVALLFLSVNARAAYFRVLDLSHPNINTGALIPVDGSAKDAIGMLAIFTHSPTDGCLLPSVVCENWTPLAVGVGGNLKSDPFLAVGPSVNLVEPAKVGIHYLLAAITKDSQLQTLMAVFVPTPEATAMDLNLAIGPTWIIKPDQNWKGFYRFFVGAAWKF